MDFCGFAESHRDILGFYFLPHSIIPVIWNLEYPLNIFFDGCLLCRAFEGILNPKRIIFCELQL